jgi:hypothetical protein
MLQRLVLIRGTRERSWTTSIIPPTASGSRSDLSIHLLSRLTDVAFTDYSGPDGNRDAEQEFRNFFNVIRDEVQRKDGFSVKIRCNFSFQKNLRNNKLKGIVDIYFDEKSHADLMFDALDG